LPGQLPSSVVRALLASSTENVVSIVTHASAATAISGTGSSG
jgi:hypothetical protein